MTTFIPEFPHLAIQQSDHVARIELARPDKANAIDGPMWGSIGAAFAWADATPEVRVVVLAGQGDHFTAGIDLGFLAAIRDEVDALPADARSPRLRTIIEDLQASVSAIETCAKPVIAEVQGACIGGGVDLITACDLRYATSDAEFSVKEVDLAIVADLGTLQRLPLVIGAGPATELALTGCHFDGDEAVTLGLVNAVAADADALQVQVAEVAAIIASKSPATVRGIKRALRISRDQGVTAGLAWVAEHNSCHLLGPDVEEAVKAMMMGTEPEFED
jgi:enoyl-CoA hydratase/carnithine racemase